MNGFDKTVVIRGVKFFSGTIDGKDIESGKFYVDEQIDETAGNAKGMYTVEYSAPCELAKASMTLDFPMTANCHFSMKQVNAGSGKAHKLTIDRFHPVKNALDDPLRARPAAKV